MEKKGFLKLLMIDSSFRYELVHRGDSRPVTGKKQARVGQGAEDWMKGFWVDGVGREVGSERDYEVE